MLKITYSIFNYKDFRALIKKKRNIISAFPI